jgi:hypothetical protein
VDSMVKTVHIQPFHMLHLSIYKLVANKSSDTAKLTLILQDRLTPPTGVPKKQPADRQKKEEVVQESLDSEGVSIKSKPAVEVEEEEWGEFEQEKERDCCTSGSTWIYTVLTLYYS